MEPTGDEAIDAGLGVRQPGWMELRLVVRDPEVIAELSRRAEGAEREGYAAAALRLGVLAIRQAGGALDATAIHREAERMLAEVDKLVTGNARTLAGDIASSLSRYFDPGSGMLTERLDRLVKKDGELAAILAGKLEGEGSPLAQTLARFVGENSPIFRMLSPSEKEGLLSRLEATVKGSLDEHKKTIVGQFSLDDPDSALSRLVEGLRKQVTELASTNQQFHSDLRVTLESMKVRREEAARGTQHGLEFEQLVGQVLAMDAQQAGDTCESTGNAPGLVPRSKVGDYVLTLGPESRAAGMRIAIECKEKADYTEAKALEEIAEARRNRGAQIGLFIFSSQSVPSGWPPLRRVGQDIVCVWNKEDPQSDVVLRAALSVARALAFRERVVRERTSTDVSEIEEAVNKIEKDAKALGDVVMWAGNIARDSKKILESVGPIQGSLEAQIKRLRDTVADLRREDGEGGMA